MAFTSLLWAAVGLGGVCGIIPKDGESGRLPTLGWNSWNAYRCDINEQKVLRVAKEMVEFGLADAGYNYANIDDCWSVKGKRTTDTGEIIPDPVRFPRGIDTLAKDIHAMGLKIGIYSDAGSETCAGYPGSLLHEETDAASFAKWGIDYLKYDNCNVPEPWSDYYHNCHPDYNRPQGPNGTCVNDPRAAPPGFDWSKSKAAERYRRMSDALAKQDRTILLALCNWGQADVQTWGNSTGVSWRISDDIFPWWDKITNIININSFEMNQVNFFGHNDADMLDIGNGELTYTESRTHFALWAAMKSPLLIGTDLEKLASDKMDILKNKHLLKFNQDPVFGKPAVPFNWDWSFNRTHPAAYWSGDSVEGRLVLMVNYQNNKRQMSVHFGDVPGLSAKNYTVMDVWTGEQSCVGEEWKVDVERHDTVAVIVKGEC